MTRLYFEVAVNTTTRDEEALTAHLYEATNITQNCVVSSALR